MASLYFISEQVRLRRQAERDLRYHMWNEWRKKQKNQFSYRDDEEKRWARELWESYPEYLLDDVFWQGPNGEGFPAEPVDR